MKIRHSFISKYLFLIIAALLIWPFLPALYYAPHLLWNSTPKYDTEELEKMWEQEAQQLNGANADRIDKQLQRIQAKYPDSILYWVDGSGKTRFIAERIPGIPEHWTVTDAAAIKENNKLLDTFIITSSIGNDSKQGFMVFQIPASSTILSIDSKVDRSMLTILILVACASLFLVSLFFILNIRKRLIQLQLSMTHTGENGIPNEVVIRRKDEIGQLEKSFNRMISQLRDSKNREMEEEQLRRELIANISHDLRTPLTIIEQQAYSILNSSSPQAKAATDIIVNKCEDISKLLDNLVSLTLLSAGKYPFTIQSTDVIEEFRFAIAAWYPIFEKEGLEVEIHLHEETIIWQVDPLWLRRILDNLFQNVVRHAKSGKYVGFQTAVQNGVMYLIVKDKGFGMKHASQAKGAGIGLTMVQLMTKEMNINLEINTSSEGTRISLTKILEEQVINRSEHSQQRTGIIH
jgi:signal transduction histidine kinase